jgi:periplasmic protein TonB
MKPNVPLYEFMPYGAPELLEFRRRFMSRALVVTSALALVVYAIAGGISPLFAVAPVERPPIIVDTYVFEFEPKRPPDVAPAPSTPAPPAIQKAAEPIPVKDDIAPPSDIPAPPTTTTSDAKGTGEWIPTGQTGDTGKVEETLPPLGTWVYVEREPAAIMEVKPEYPGIARDAQIEGRVTVHVLIGKDGHVLDAVLAQNIRVPMLNDAALKAARQWRFTPGMANGHPVACWTAIPFVFRLH